MELGTARPSFRGLGFGEVGDDKMVPARQSYIRTW